MNVSNLENASIENPVCPVCGTSYQAGTTHCAADGAKLVSPDKLIPRGGAVNPGAPGYVAGVNTPAFRKASVFFRFIAWLVDELITGILSIPSIILFVLFCEESGHYGHDADTYFMISLVTGLIPIIYFLIKDGLFQGQSVGKKVVGIKVINIRDASNCTKGRSAIRALAGVLVSLVCFGGIVEPCLVLFSSEGRRLADRAASTMVVKA